MKKLFALILAVLMLAGCQLASEEKREDTTQDRLAGVFITFERLDLDFDIEGWLNDNGISGDAEIDMAEGFAYQEKLPVTIGDDGWVVPGHEGLSIGRYWNGEYWTGFSSEGICELNSNIAAGDDGDTIEVEGTVCFPMDSEVMLCANRGVPLTTRGRKGAGQACWNIAQRLDGLSVPIMRIRKQGLI